MQLISITPAAEVDTLFRAVLGAATVAVGDKESIQMGVSFGLPDLLQDLSKAEQGNENLRSAISDALAVFRL